MAFKIEFDEKGRPKLIVFPDGTSLALSAGTSVEKAVTLARLYRECVKAEVKVAKAEKEEKPVKPAKPIKQEGELRFVECVVDGARRRVYLVEQCYDLLRLRVGDYFTVIDRSTETYLTANSCGKFIAKLQLPIPGTKPRSVFKLERKVERADLARAKATLSSRYKRLVEEVKTRGGVKGTVKEFTTFAHSIRMGLDLLLKVLEKEGFVVEKSGDEVRVYSREKWMELQRRREEEEEERRKRLIRSVREGITVG